MEFYNVLVSTAIEITAFVVLVLSIVAYNQFKPKVEAFLEANLTQQQLATLKQLCDFAVVAARERFKTMDGKAQYEAAVELVVGGLQAKGIFLDEEVVK
ncbi:hypothetical protein [Heliophilum fasciatum]|uniref:Uncharacterized protein n=1 Tax=Heliophilum fasciatum TaxID=35700 RepID=A0A4R2S6W0_9FIRM|nr:hypothetical protein [Heliophilum fasciatum]MCW2277244.1 hypothetical protein [Heliophilum fasciatum]TCP68121.1 hypothetical protein EDD73_10423 [Heliophilum fasciatum]